jgi:protein TonB
MLFVSWRLIELKTYEKEQFDYESILVEQDEEEEIPLTEQIKTPPPVQAPTEIEIVEDEEEVEETIIESTETDRDEIIEVEDVVIEEEEEIIDVPFAVIEDVPVFPGCENVEKDQLRNCFQEQMNKHIRRNFRYPEIAQEMGIKGRLYVNFIISEDGSITNIRMRGPDKNLEGEAKRIISLLPNMTPGKQRGRPVRVPFSIPIVFRLQ